MELILVGLKISTLIALIPETDKIESVIISKSLDTLDPNAQAFEQGSGLIIIDLSCSNVSYEAHFNKLRSTFPTHQVWAYYTFLNDVIRKQLQLIGFHKVLSLHDDIPSMVYHFFESTRNRDTLTY